MIWCQLQHLHVCYNVEYNSMQLKSYFATEYQIILKYILPRICLGPYYQSMYVGK